MFTIFALGTVPLHPPTFYGVQNLLAILLFVGCVVLTAREVASDPSLIARIDWALDRALIMAVVLYVLDITRILPSRMSLIGPRPLAIFLLIPLGRQLALWRGGQRRGLVISVLIVLVIFHSMSRMALVAGAAMFPLAVLARGDRKALLQTIGMCVLAGGALCASIYYYQPMYDRFFTEDTSLKVGDIAINAAGRTQVWEDIWTSFLRHPIIGQGAGSNTPYVSVEGMGHPHNDYLLLAHDYGVIGLGLWTIGVLAILAQLLRAAKIAGDYELPFAWTHITAFAVLVGVSITMASDNSLIYVFVMAPLGVMIGTSLGAAQHCGISPGLFAHQRLIDSGRLREVVG
jgi:O-antigen ligase